MDDPRQLELNTIKMTFISITGIKKIAQEDKGEGEGENVGLDPAQPREPETRYVHEKIAEKFGHSGCAALAPPVQSDEVERAESVDYRFSNKKPTTFIFHYAPKGEPVPLVWNCLALMINPNGDKKNGCRTEVLFVRQHLY